MPEFEEATPSEKLDRPGRTVDSNAPDNVGLTPAGARSVSPGRSANPGMLASMQRMAGNAAVAGWISRPKRSQRSKTGSEMDAGHHDHEPATVQTMALQRDDNAPASAGGTDPSPSPADGGAGMTVDHFQTTFDSDQLVSEMGNLDDSQLGAGDLAPDAAQTPSDPNTATAQAMPIQRITVQRDPPPPSAGPPPSGPTPQQAGAPDGAPAAKPGSPGDVVKAVAQLPEVKKCMDDVKQQAVIQWDKLKADPIALTSTATITAMILAGGVAGIDSNPATRTAALNMIFGKDIPLPVPDLAGGPKLPGLSFKILGANGTPNGVFFTLDFAKVLGWSSPSPSPTSSDTTSTTSSGGSTSQ